MTTNAEGTRGETEFDDVLASARSKIAAQRPKRDPFVAWLTVGIFLVVIFALVTVVYSILTGVLGTGAPRTMSEKKLIGTRAKIDGGSKDRVDWLTYIFTLTDEGRYREAQEWIDKGEKSLKDQDAYQDMAYAQADLYLAQGKEDQALKTADAALKQIKKRYKEGLVEAEKTGNPDIASAYGLVETYWELLLLKAEVYEGKQNWKAALKAYNEYLGHEKTAASVFAQRGVVKEKLGDKKGAEADFKQTLVFIPDDETARNGLKRIGAAQ